MKLTTTLAALTLALLAACGGTDVKAEITAGYTEMGRSNYNGALTHFQKALEELEPGSESYVEAKMGEIETWVFLDADRAQAEFLTLAKAQPDKVGIKDYTTVGSKMTSAKQFTQAIKVLDEGTQRFDKDPKLVEFAAVIKREAEKAGDANAISALQSLGYL
jgi:hypothetical protein